LKAVLWNGEPEPVFVNPEFGAPGPNPGGNGLPYFEGSAFSFKFSPVESELDGDSSSSSELSMSSWDISSGTASSSGSGSCAGSFGCSTGCTGATGC